MKKILALCGVVLVIGGVFIYRALQVPLVYGAFVGAPRAETADVIARPEAFMHKIIALQDVIRNQCASMGCYFYFRVGEDDNRMLRIELAPIAMHAPRGRTGRMAHVEGQIVPYEKSYQLLATAVEFK
jgi:hypothetical protein